MKTYKKLSEMKNGETFISNGKTFVFIRYYRHMYEVFSIVANGIISLADDTYEMEER